MRSPSTARTGSFGSHCQMRNMADTSQGLTTEAVGADGCQILKLLQL